MARDLANVSQEVELLKASIAELKASQQQMARDLAKASENKASEQNARARIAALPPRPAVARPHKPIAPYPSAQAYPPGRPIRRRHKPRQLPRRKPPHPTSPRQPEPLPPAVDSAAGRTRIYVGAAAADAGAVAIA